MLTWIKSISMALVQQEPPGIIRILRGKWSWFRLVYTISFRIVVEEQREAGLTQRDKLLIQYNAILQ